MTFMPGTITYPLCSAPQPPKSGRHGSITRPRRNYWGTPQAHILLFLVSSGDHAIAWLQSDLAQFFEDFTSELPSALERVLGNQVHNVRPRWAKGTAHRVARLLSDHIEELERRDALLGDGFPSSQGGHHG